LSRRPVQWGYCSIGQADVHLGDKAVPAIHGVTDQISSFLEFLDFDILKIGHMIDAATSL